MTLIPIDDIPPLWLEPWRFAAPAWHAMYGAPLLDFDRHAARLVYSGWSACFGLPRQWKPPPDPGWLAVLWAPPALLHRVVTTLGYIALLRAGVSGPLLRAQAPDRVKSCALKYREVNCMESALVARRPLDWAARRDSPTAHDCGVDVLRAMARHNWLDVESRIAMLAAPDVKGAPSVPDRTSGWTHCAPGNVLRIDRIDVRRCLSLCGAAARHLAADSTMSGGQ